MAGNVPLDLIFFMGRGHHHSNHAIHDRNFTLPKNSTRKTSKKTKLWLSKCSNIPKWTSFKIHSNLFSSFFAYKSYLRSRSFPKSCICAGKQTESSDGSSHFPSIQIHHFWHCTSLIRWKQYWYKMCDYFTRKVLLACEKKGYCVDLFFWPDKTLIQFRHFDGIRLTWKRISSLLKARGKLTLQHSFDGCSIAQRTLLLSSRFLIKCLHCLGFCFCGVSFDARDVRRQVSLVLLASFSVNRWSVAFWCHRH